VAAEVVRENWEAAGLTPSSGGTLEERRSALRRQLSGERCALLRCVFGNPFRPARIDPFWLRWRGGLVASMAQRMYEARDFADLPVLADALEEAGCDNEEVLVHLHKQGAVHVRGCFVLDLLLNKG
jgi:hypothetical protein